MWFLRCGGPQNLGFTRQDAYYHLMVVKRNTKVENVDVNNLMQYFISKSYAEPYFFWKVQFDDDGRIMNSCFSKIHGVLMIITYLEMFCQLTPPIIPIGTTSFVLLLST